MTKEEKVLANRLNSKKTYERHADTKRKYYQENKEKIAKRQLKVYNQRLIDSGKLRVNNSKNFIMNPTGFF